MRTTSRRTSFAALAIALLAAAPLAAQGTASTQGFGYPPGQLGSRSAATGGSFAEFDETTPLNPSSILSWRDAGLHFQYEPEFRSVVANGETIRTAVNRVPVVVAALPLGNRAAVGASISPMLDRSWAIDIVDRRLVGAESLYVDEHSTSDGGMNDVRLAFAWSVSRWLDVGAAAHAIIGLDRFNQAVTLSRADPRTTTSTSTEFSPYVQSADIRFSGRAFSAGARITPFKQLSVGLSARRGQTITLTRRDSTLSTARVPDRLGAAVLYEVVPRTFVAAGAEWIGWSSLDALTNSSKPHDAVGLSFGVETPGPRFAGRALTLRGGIRRRDLAYDAPVSGTGSSTIFDPVHENAVTFGVSAPFAYNRALVQLYGQRAMRSVAAEKSFTVGIGFSIRP